MLKLPVLFLIFNRKLLSVKAFKCIRDYAPQKLYIAADGPRPEKENEYKDCEDTRNSILDLIDWECEVHKLFREKNLGCAQAVYEGITWFFEHEEYGISIEDDVHLSQDFFKLCEVLLPYYKDDRRMMHINSENFAMSNKATSTYTFNKQMHCWGWASWRRAWQQMDMSMSKWPSFKKWKLIRYEGIMKCIFHLRYWNNTYKHLETSSSWATRWSFTIFSDNKFLCITPLTHLSQNIGVDSGGTHFKAGEINPYKYVEIGKIIFPIQHPSKIKLDNKMLFFEVLEFYRVKYYAIIKKISRQFS